MTWESPSKARPLLTAPFTVALIMLLVATVLSGPVAQRMKLQQTKQLLPLRKPLGELNESSLAPYRVIHRQTLDPSIIEALGTEQYLSWTLEDESLPLKDPLRYAILFVTYYSGGSNLVPHTPDVCYLGAGYDPAQPHENIELPIPSLGDPLRSIPVRVCTFAKTAVFSKEEITVLYTFSANGRFSAGQRHVRVIIHELGNTYAYFSKVELGFPRATRLESIEGAKKLLDRVLPKLIQDHWPDFDRAEQEARQSAEKA